MKTSAKQKGSLVHRPRKIDPHLPRITSCDLQLKNTSKWKTCSLCFKILLFTAIGLSLGIQKDRNREASSQDDSDVLLLPSPAANLKGALRAVRLPAIHSCRRCASRRHATERCPSSRLIVTSEVDPSPTVPRPITHRMKEVFITIDAHGQRRSTLKAPPQKKRLTHQPRRVEATAPKELPIG